MLVFCFVFAFVTFLCLFVTSFSFLICGSLSSNVRFCLYFSLFLAIGTLTCMFWIQETHPEFFQSPVSKVVKECSFKTPTKVI